MPSATRSRAQLPVPPSTPRAPRPSPPVPGASAEAATRVLRRFRSVLNAVKTHFKQVQKQAGIGGAQLRALLKLLPPEARAARTPPAPAIGP